MKRVLLWAMCLILTAILLTGARKKKAADPLGYRSQKAFQELADRFRHWLDLTAYIASSEERQVFLSLTSDRDRDMFGEIFWKQRDPTPGTTENEFRVEIERRFAYANEIYSRSSPRPGWQTDMGRIYMILGQPSSSETFDSVAGLYPAQVWYYYGDETSGLPNYFNVTFFKRYGSGEWVIYDPVADGPEALIAGQRESDSENYRALYEQIRKRAPSLAGPAISMIPGQQPASYAPSTRNNVIMGRIYTAPLRRISLAYAENFLKYKGYVSVDSSVNFVDSSHLLTIIREERNGIPLLTFSVKPKKISVGFNQERGNYYFSLHLVATLRQQERLVYQQSKNFEYSLAASQLDVLKAGGVVVHDNFPVIPGNYEFSVFLQNQLSREFSFFEVPLRVPPLDASPHLALPLVGYKQEQQSSNFFYPYNINDLRLAVDTDKTFGRNEKPIFLIGLYGLNEKIRAGGKLAWELHALSPRSVDRRSGIMPLNEFPPRAQVNLLWSAPDPDLQPDYYELLLRLTDPGGALLDSKILNFTVSPLAKLSRPTEMYSQVLADNPFHWEYVLGLEYHNVGDASRAAEHLSRCVELNPRFSEGWRTLLDLWLRQGKFSEVAADCERLQNDANQGFAYHRIKGEAFFGLNRYDEALTEFLAANQLNDSDFALINRIGATYLRLGDKKQALEAFSASLRLNPGQAEINKLVQRLGQD